VPGLISGNTGGAGARPSGADNSSAGAPKPVFMAKIDLFSKWWRERQLQPAAVPGKLIFRF